jgi:hypothetical protein
MILVLESDDSGLATGIFSLPLSLGFPLEEKFFLYYFSFLAQLKIKGDL